MAAASASRMMGVSRPNVRSVMSEQRRERWTGAVTSAEDPPMLAPDGIGFRDRREAGVRLAVLLERWRAQQPVVIGIARGGVAVAAEVASALDAPLDVAVVRKVGAPQNPEFAIGAVAEGDVHVLSGGAVRALQLSGEEVERLVASAEHELEERLGRYRGIRAPVDLAGRTAIVVDDGLATGRSALAAVRSVRRRGAARVVLAAPVASPSAVAALRGEVDDIVCVEVPEDLWAVGYWYEDFSPTTDREVAELLRAAGGDGGALAAARPDVEQVTIPIEPGLALHGDLTVPPDASGIVAFAHGSGSGRLSPRNRAVARALNAAGFATLLLDLLTEEEEGVRGNVFDIELLASRLASASAWLAQRSDVGALPLGYFGASTGAGAALTAAADLGERVGAIVSRGGRPDLARDPGEVRAPTLLIVGGADDQVLELNRQARRRLHCPSELVVIPGATHLFEEAGALEQVARLAIDWFAHQLAPRRPGTGDERAAEEG
jgi:putative phosphoribosyl transferase